MAGQTGFTGLVLESVPYCQGRAPSPLSDDRRPLLRLLCQIPELVIGDDDPISLFGQPHHEPVSKTTATTLGFPKVPTLNSIIDSHDPVLVIEIRHPPHPDQATSQLTIQMPWAREETKANRRGLPIACPPLTTVPTWCLVRKRQ